MACQDKVIEKIKKVLELSRNNPSEEEAQAAALKAQKLMAEYHISMKQVDDVTDIENIVENRVDVGKGKKWKYQLACVIAENFRCRHFYYGRGTVVFYGYQTDAEIAAEVFKYLFKVGNTAASSYHHKICYETLKRHGYFDGRGIMNSFLSGYMTGIKEELGRQCTALMIVVPKEVNTSCDERLKGAKSMTANFYIHNYDRDARKVGYTTGKEAIQKKQLEEKVG